MIYKNITQTVGKTPLVKLNNYKKSQKLFANIIAKLECFNPCGSVKDRIALAMIEDAEKRAVINKNTTIIEATSGNTGIGLGCVCAVKKYKLILTMPESMSLERRKLLKALGASLVLTEAEKGMKGAREKAEQIASCVSNSFIVNQFENEENVRIHYKTTAPEIWKDTKGKVDIFVSGVGTGGTISGACKFLKEKNSKIKVIAVEPHSSPILSGGSASAHKIQGIGAGFVPKILNTDIYDEIITVKNEDAFKFCCLIAKEEGLIVGISSGAALCAATKIAQQKENAGKNIVVIFPDTGERYLSTDLYDDKS